MRREGAGFWRRLGAGLIDFLLIYSVASLLVAIARLVSVRVSLELACIVVAAIYGVVLLGTWSATAGKVLLGLRVRPKNADTLSYATAFLREAVGKYGLTLVLPILVARRIAGGFWIESVCDVVVILLVQVLMLVYYLFTRKTWYDRLARTSVSREGGQSVLGARAAFAAVAVTAVLCGGTKTAEYLRWGWIPSDLALFNNSRPRHQHAQTWAESGLLAVAVAGFLIAIVAFARLKAAPQNR